MGLERSSVVSTACSCRGPGAQTALHICLFQKIWWLLLASLCARPACGAHICMQAKHLRTYNRNKLNYKKKNNSETWPHYRCTVLKTVYCGGSGGKCRNLATLQAVARDQSMSLSQNRQGKEDCVLSIAWLTLYVQDPRFNLYPKYHEWRRRRRKGSEKRRMGRKMRRRKRGAWHTDRDRQNNKAGQKSRGTLNNWRWDNLL